jgi:hypothetical protein
MPAIAKIIHRKGLAYIQSHQQYIVVTATRHHSQKRDEKKNKHEQVHIHRGRGSGPQSQAWAYRVTTPGHGKG